MKRPSPRQVALLGVSVADDARRLAATQAHRAEEGFYSARDAVSERIHPKPRHRLRNSLLGAAGALITLVVAAGLVGRRRSTAPSPVEQAGMAARGESFVRERQPSSGLTDTVAAGAAAVKTGAQAVEDDVALGARTVAHAPSNAVHEQVDAAKEKVADVKEVVAAKLVKVAILAGIGLTAYILVMSVIVALIVKWIV